MESIIQHVSNENKKWASELDPKDIAQILDTLCLIPNMRVPRVVPFEPDTLENEERTPAIKGQEGENQFENIIMQYMPSDYKLINTAKTGKCGDFIIKWQSSNTNKIYSIIIDVKNYKNTVPGIEVDKFYRDLKVNSNIHGGLLLSLHSKIIGINKIIEFKEYVNDNKNIPIIFAKSKTPEVICEIIKLLFHMIEIKDMNNDVSNKNNLIVHINSLNDSIQLITNCRNTLLQSKMDIEKSLNGIMFNLMSCEYNLVDKIKSINSTMVTPIEVVSVASKIESITMENQLGLEGSNDPESKQSDPESKQIDTVRNIVQIFGSSLDISCEPLLYDIYNSGEWISNSINVNKKQWKLFKSNSFIVVKFTKKNMTAVFAALTDDMLIVIQNINAKYGKSKCDGFNIIINSDSINQIVELIKLIN
jgi:hypothetical protein